MRHFKISALIAAVSGAVILAGSASAQSAQNTGPFTYLGSSGTLVVMISDLPRVTPAAEATVWVWHFHGAANEGSTSAGNFARAVQMTVNCSNRTTINRKSDHYIGSTFSRTIDLSSYARTTGFETGATAALPLRAVCDPAPTTPRATYPDLATARAYADLRLKPPPAARPAPASSSALRNLTYMARSSRAAVLVADAPSAPVTGQREIWVWNLRSPTDSLSNATGSYSDVSRVLVDCADRTTIEGAVDSYNGTTFGRRTETAGRSIWMLPRENTLAILPVQAVCDAPPSAPRTVFPDFATARARADQVFREATQP